MEQRLTGRAGVAGRFGIVLSALMVLSLAPRGASPAEEAPPAGGGGGAATSPQLPSVTIDRPDEELRVILKQIQDLTGVNVRVDDPELEKKKVTLQVTNLRVDQALRILAAKLKGRIEQVETNLYVLSKPQTVTMTFNKADIREVITNIAKLSNKNILISPSVQGEVTMNLKDVSWEDALKTVASTYGYAVVKTEREDLYSVVDPKTLVQNLMTRFFRLKFVQPPGTYRPKVQTLEIAVGNPTAPADDPKTSFPLFRALNSVLSKDGKIEFDRDSNSFMVTDIATKLDEVAKIIQEVDKKPLQVMVDVKFVTYTDTDTLDFGVNWRTGFDATISGSSVPSKLPFTNGKGGFEDLVTPFENPASDGDEGPPSIALPGVVQVPPTIYGVLDFTRTSLNLRLLKTRADATIGETPKLVTLDNQEATIFVGDSVRYAEATVQTGTGGSTIVTGIQEGRSSPVNIGFQLLMQPHIIPETGEILLTLYPKQDSLTGASSPIAGFDRFTAGGQEIDLPRVSTRSLVTKVILKTGQTVVIGGLTADSLSTTYRSLPVLGDIPILGWLFKSKAVSNTKRKLIIFVTVDILADGQQADTATDRLLGREKPMGGGEPRSGETPK